MALNRVLGTVHGSLSFQVVVILVGIVTISVFIIILVVHVSDLSQKDRASMLDAMDSSLSLEMMIVV